MHSLGRKEDEQSSTAVGSFEVPKVPSALTTLPPKPK